jgi:hypothetical protein
LNREFASDVRYRDDLILKSLKKFGFVLPPRRLSPSLMPEDAKEAIGHGIRAKRSKLGAVSFDLLVTATGEESRAAV